MDKKYLFFDIDGTLTDPETAILVPSAVETLAKLQENGHFVAIATGRAYYKAKDIMKDCGLRNMVCYGGGGLVIDEKLVKCEPLDIKMVKKLAHECDDKNIGYFVLLDDSENAYSKDDLFNKQTENRVTGFNHIINKNFDIDSVDTVYKMYAAISKDKEEDIVSLKDWGFLRLRDPYVIIQYDKKDEGIKQMVEYLHGDEKDIVVFGDDTNDMIMFRPEWTSIAMGNGIDALKEKASYVTAKSVDDGVKKACEHFGWI